MRLLEFYNVFPDEQTCKLEFIKNRLEEGVIKAVKLWKTVSYPLALGL